MGRRWHRGRQAALWRSSCHLSLSCSHSGATQERPPGCHSHQSAWLASPLKSKSVQFPPLLPSFVSPRLQRVEMQLSCRLSTTDCIHRATSKTCTTPLKTVINGVGVLIIFPWDARNPHFPFEMAVLIITHEQRGYSIHSLLPPAVNTSQLSR